MKTTLTREEIRKHADALEDLESLERWKKKSTKEARLVYEYQTTAFRIEWSLEGHVTEIFRRHIDEAAEEAIVLLKERAGLE